MIKQFDFLENIPHEVSELICLKCGNRWIGVYPQETLLKELECKCGCVGMVIKTGQTLDLTDNECEKCANYHDGKCKIGMSGNTEIYCEYFRKP